MKYPIQLVRSRPAATASAGNIGVALRRTMRDAEITVISCDGSPGVGAIVTLGGQRATADGSGIARFTIAPGTYTLTAGGLGIPAVPGTPATIFLSDSFVGAAGEVTGHTPDIGSTWVDGNSSAPGYRPTLDGSGNLVISGYSTLDCSCPDVPAATDYYVEVDLTLGASADGGSGVSICLRNQATNNMRCRVNFFPYTGSGTTAQFSTGGSRIYNVTEPVIFSPNYAKLTMLTFRVEVVGSDIRALVDGVEKMAFGNFTTDETSGGVGLQIWDENTSVQAIRAGAFDGTSDIPASGCADHSEIITIR